MYTLAFGGPWMQGHILRISVLSAAYDGAACYVPQSSAVPVPSERHVLPGPKNFKCALADGSLYLFIDLNTKQKQTIAGHSSESSSPSRPS